MGDEATFTVGPPLPVTDPNHLPAVTDEDEAGFVHGADLGYDHPDNGFSDAEVGALLAEDLPSEDELDVLVADVNPDDVDAIGFNDADLEEPLETDGTAPEGGS